MSAENKMAPIFAELNQELKEILSYWPRHAMDEQNGGFIGEVTCEGRQIENAEKGVVLNARLLWTFSAAYNFYGDSEHLALANRAYHYLVNHFWDAENGGVFWSLHADGTPNNKRKQAYAQGFAVYGFSEYFKASGKQASLDYAIQLYRLMEVNFRDPEFGGYIEALDEQWQPLNDMRLSLKDANEPKSMNTHLHIIEPYANLYRVWSDEGLKNSILHLLEIFKDKIINSETHHFELFFGMDWRIKSGIVSYGHDIEGAWLLTEAAEVIQHKKWLEQMEQIALKMVDATIAEGTDTDGSLFYEKEGDHLDTDKHWWPQAEAMVGLLEAYRISKKEHYLEAALNVWKFIQTTMKDHEFGEWFSKVDKNGKPDKSAPKVGFWKCSYHNSRALIEAMQRIQAL